MSKNVVVVGSPREGAIYEFGPTRISVLSHGSKVKDGETVSYARVNLLDLNRKVSIFLNENTLNDWAKQGGIEGTVKVGANVILKDTYMFALGKDGAGTCTPIS